MLFFLYFSSTDVIEMNSKVAPQTKINSIVNCSKNILSIINLSQGVTVSADEFLPAMVYVVLKANPPLLHSNVKYITNYSIPARLRSGEGAYYFTNMVRISNFVVVVNFKCIGDFSHLIKSPREYLL